MRKWKESLDKIRDYDLLLISLSPIDTNQNWCNVELFQQMKDQKSDKFLALAQNVRKTENNFVKIKVHAGLEDFFYSNKAKIFSKEAFLYCYSVGSLLTTIREFRTIKNCEFFSNGDAILNPREGIK